MGLNSHALLEANAQSSKAASWNHKCKTLLSLNASKERVGNTKQFTLLPPPKKQMRGKDALLGLLQQTHIAHSPVFFVYFSWSKISPHFLARKQENWTWEIITPNFLGDFSKGIHTTVHKTRWCEAGKEGCSPHLSSEGFCEKFWGSRGRKNGKTPIDPHFGGKQSFFLASIPRLLSRPFDLASLGDLVDYSPPVFGSVEGG